MSWLVFEGENGIDFIFDEVQNRSKKHRRDDALIPFKTKVDNIFVMLHMALMTDNMKRVDHFISDAVSSCHLAYKLPPDDI